MRLFAFMAVLIVFVAGVTDRVPAGVATRKAGNMARVATKAVNTASMVPRKGYSSKTWRTAITSCIKKGARTPTRIDPCLPPTCRDWRDSAQSEEASRLRRRYREARLVIDLPTFRLTLQGVRADGSAEIVYRCAVGIGQSNSPTPEGTYLINHVYCYPDVIYFGSGGVPTAGLYRGLLAPILACDETGRCERYNDLGIHGFDQRVLSGSQTGRSETVGPVSGGCIRIPDPCSFKRALVRVAGLGPLKKDDRGSYHWLNRPVRVWIVGEPRTIISIIGAGLNHVEGHVGSFLKGIWGSEE
ncbi:MAG: L,D-transpeptidase [Pseudomonadota bacterium]